ncbi:hypothetical protein [Sphingopyxis sp. 113P3]|uniref:hypothetical protein n=1 Tax=Sphingopyxis sp. (strain 113P3) TaxID=292913 RepID=UPI0006AD16C6|nr:hypothetical protein [Sphingopyxis sp. 113P3]ALC11213.1 hypothetical protein LH20_04530 [Sphingopyxis sp. 113P3]
MIVDGEGVARFVSERLGITLCPPYTTLGIERDGELVGGVIFHCFEGSAVHVTVAGKGWTRGFLRAVGHYVYRQLDCARMTITTGQPEVVSYAKRLGGQVEGVLRDQYGPGQDATIVGILARDWRY